MKKRNPFKGRTMMDIFRKYPFIKPHEGNITRPSLTGCSIQPNKKVSLTWRQWHELMKIYLKYLGLYILSGSKVTLPYKMGIIQLHKLKTDKKRIDIYHYMKTGEYKEFKNNHTDGYRVSFRWYRNDNQAALKNKWHWKCVLNVNFRKKISEAIMDDPHLLLSYSEKLRYNTKK